MTKTPEEMFDKYSKENCLDLEQVRAILPFVKWLDSHAQQFRSQPETESKTVEVSRFLDTLWEEWGAGYGCNENPNNAKATAFKQLFKIISNQPPTKTAEAIAKEMGFNTGLSYHYSNIVEAIKAYPHFHASPQSNTVPTDEDIHEMACEYVAQMEPCSSNAQLHALEEFTQGAAKMRSRMLSIAKEREILFGKFVRENAGLFGKNSDKNIEQLHDLYLSTKTPTTKP